MKVRSLHATALFVLAYLPCHLTSAQDEPSDYIQAIQGIQTQSSERLGDFTIDELLQELDVPGVSIAVIKDFRIHWAKAYGIADKHTGKPVDINTKFQAASISKAVNAMALLNAAEDGLIDIDTNINHYLSSWEIPHSEYTQNSVVTAKMLASHISGLGDGLGFPGYEPDDQIPTLVQILDGEEPAKTRAVRMARPPGSAYHYSGGGSTILQLALIDIYKLPYDVILMQNVLEPLGMTNSTFAQPLSAELDINAARAHTQSGIVERHKWNVYPELAAAGLWTTPTDLAIFLIESQLSLRGESNIVLTATSTEQMMSPVGVGPHAVGYTITKHGEGWYFGHGGSNHGFRANMAAHKTKGYGYVVMTNSSQGSLLISELGRRIQAAYSWDSLDQPVRR
ncbi:MAG: serine hydrolase domain-containing protein [Pseudohongiella sp.]|nr:serine hydrolase domain-containing protein [Pseudohongiella sp.]